MKPKLLTASLGLGLGMTIVLAYLVREPGRHWFDSILWIGWLAGSFVSGNVHAPNEFVGWATDCFLLSALVYIVGTLITSLLMRGRGSL